MRGKDTDLDATFFTMLSSIWITDAHMKHRTLRTLEDNVEEKLGNLLISTDF